MLVDEGEGGGDGLGLFAPVSKREENGERIEKQEREGGGPNDSVKIA